MENWQISIIVALVGLLGTLAGLFIGYRKWSYEKNREKSVQYIQDRQTAYKILWQKLEHIHAVIRKGDFESKELSDLRYEFNTHVLTTEIYLDPDDRKICNKYLDDIEAVSEGVAASENTSAQRDWEITAVFPSEHAGALEAFESMEEGRTALISKIKRVLQEENS